MSSPSMQRFNDAYESHTAPWVIDAPQAAIVRLERSGLIGGKVLDAGCGLGEHTILLASLGYDVLGVDYAPNAVAQARANAAAKGVDATFEVADATDLPDDGRYDAIVDSALFHVFGDDDRPRYVASLHGALRSGGYLHVLALSDTGRGFGPAVSEEVIRQAFADRWELESLELTTYTGVVTAMVAEQVDEPVGTVVDEPAWLARVRRL